MKALPIPDPNMARWSAKGFGRAAAIRRLRAERCSPAEIAAGLHVSVAEVRRTLQRPVRRGR